MKTFSLCLLFYPCSFASFPPLILCTSPFLSSSSSSFSVRRRVAWWGNHHLIFPGGPEGQQAHFIHFVSVMLNERMQITLTGAEFLFTHNKRKDMKKVGGKNNTLLIKTMAWRACWRAGIAQACPSAFFTHLPFVSEKCNANLSFSSAFAGWLGESVANPSYYMEWVLFTTGELLTSSSAINWSSRWLNHCYVYKG